MNNFEDVYDLNRDDRQISNLETYRRFISKGDKPLQCINDEDAKAIKDALNGKGKLLAVVDGRRTMMGNHKYVLFVKGECGVKVYLYTVLNGLYNDMGPYKDLDTAMSNADCYGLFEECKEVANKKPLSEGVYMKDELFKRIYESVEDEEFDDWDDLGYDDVYDGEMEDFSWDDEADIPDEYRNGYKTPHEELEDHLADCFPTCNEEYQDDEGGRALLFPVQKGDGEGSIGKRTIASAYAHNLRSGDNAVAYDTDDGVRKPLGSEDIDDIDDTDTKFAMYNDADLDAWSNERI